MSTNPRNSQFGGASSPNRGTGLYTGRVTLIYNDGRVRVFINTFGRNIGPCRIVNKSAGDAISLNDEVLCTYANDFPDELIVVGRLTERVDPVSESTSGLIVESTTTSELVRITQKGSGAALLVEDSTNPDSTPFIIDASGNVGIGTLTPSTKVDISGSTAITGDLTVDTSTLKVDSTNNRVGIGTASPAVSLDVLGTISARTAAVQDGVGLAGRAGGSGTYEVTLTPTTLSADRTLTLPDVSGTAITTGNLTDITSTGTLTSLTITGDLTVDTNTLKLDSTNNRVGINTTSPATALDVTGTITARAATTQDGVALAGRAGGTSTYEVTLTPTTLSADRTLTLPDVSGTAVTTGNLSVITSTGTLTSLTLSGTVTLPNSANNQIYTSTTANTALPWSDGPVLQGQTGWSFYSAVNSSYRMGFRNNVAGTTRYMWSADSALIGSQPSDAEVTNTLNVLGTGRFTGTVTAPTFSGGLAASNITGQTGMWASAGRPGPTRLYRNDNDDAYNVQTYWTGSRWRLYGYLNNTGHADTHVGYADSSGTSSNVYGSSAALVGYMNISGAGIGYNGATIGGGSPNLIGFRWTNPSVNCTVDNVISAEAANFSDRRLKTNIESYVNGLLAVRSLRPVTFNPLDIVSFDDNGEPIVGDSDPYDEKVGFIADEVEAIIPSAVNGTGVQLKSISTLQILSVAVAAIKELDAKVSELTEKVRVLEGQ